MNSSNEWIIRIHPKLYDEAISATQIEDVLSRSEVDFDVIHRLGLSGAALVRTEDSASAERALGQLAGLEYFEPNHVIQGFAPPPNDTLFSNQHALTAINAQAAWDVLADPSGANDLIPGSREVVVAVIDSGVDYTHPDLYRNIWINPGEIPSEFKSQIDDVDGDGLITFIDLNDVINVNVVADGNDNGYIDADDLLRPMDLQLGVNHGGWEDGVNNDGNSIASIEFVDDIIGWNFDSWNNKPFDVSGHGTHVSGIIGASGNNDLGVTGVNWETSIMPLRFLGANNLGSLANAELAIAYMNQMASRTIEPIKVRVSNASWGFREFSPSLLEQLRESLIQDILIVAASGNGNALGAGLNNDVAPVLPASYDLDNIISVAASDSEDNFAPFSNFGFQSVDIASPGIDVLSTNPTSGSAQPNVSRNGTSMSAPHVAGVAALVLSKVPHASVQEVREALLQTARPIAAFGMSVASGGILDASSAMAIDVFAPRARLEGNSVVNEAGATEYAFRVLYEDDTAIDASTLDDDDILVRRVGGVPFEAAATFDLAAGVYHITPPDGSWDFVDNGVYEVFLRADHDTVTDLAGNTARPQFGEISDPIGSFEVQIEIVPVGTVFTVDTLTDSIDADLADFMCRDAAGNCSLRAAIQQANVMEGEQTVVFKEAGVYMLTITNDGENIDSAKGDLDIQDDLTIIGHGADQTTINAAKTDRVFEIGTVRVNISRVTITGGDPGPGRDGGGIYNNGNLLLHQSTVVGNSAERGGGIYSDWRGEVPGILTLLETHVDENVATETRGGGVYARDLRVIIQNSSFAGNSSKHAGGAINIFDGELFVTGTTFSQNRTDSGVPSIRSQGGAIYSDSPRSEITTSSFTGNSATSGGAIFTNGTLRVLESRFNSNSAPDFAGAIYANRDVELLEIQQSEFLGNTSRGDGGAIRSYADEVTIRDSLFSDNESENAGGAIQFNDAVGVKIANSMFERNKAVNNSGGAISAERSLEMVDIVHSSFRENTASSAGAILNHTVMTIKDSEFTGNVASQSTGGAIENNDSLAELTILRSVLVNNSADYAGGGVESNGKIVRIGASTIVKNSAPRGANVDGEFESLGGNLIGAGTTLNSGGSQVQGNEIHGRVVDAVQESGLEGWITFLDLNENGLLDSGELRTTTNLEGRYRFGGLPAGNYVVVLQLPAENWTQTKPDPNDQEVVQRLRGKYFVSLQDDDVVTAIDFAVAELAAGSSTGVIRGKLFEDENKNGRQDDGEPGLVNYIVFLDKNGDGILDGDGDDQQEAGEEVWVRSDATGAYEFTSLLKGRYRVVARPESNSEQILPRSNLLVRNEEAVHPAVAALVSPESALVGDFTRDGRTDIVVLNTGNNKLILLSQQPDGQFAASDLPGVFRGPSSGIAAKLNADDQPDLVILNRLAHAGTVAKPVAVLMSRSDGSYEATSLGIPGFARAIAAGKINDDELDDLVVATKTEIFVVMNSKQGFTAPVAVTSFTGETPASVVLADVIGDARQDLVVADFDGNAVHILPNENGVFGMAQIEILDSVVLGIEGVAARPFALSVAQLDSDDFNDIAVASYEADRVVLLFNDIMNKGTFTEIRSVAVSQPTAILATDVDLDQDLDLVVQTTNDPNNPVSIISNPGTRRFPTDATGTAFDCLACSALGVARNLTTLMLGNSQHLVVPKPKSNEVLVLKNQIVDGVQQIDLATGGQRSDVDFAFSNTTVTVTLDTANVIEAAGSFTFTGTLSSVSTKDVTVTLGFQGSAISGIDYTSATSEIVIPAGATSGSLTLTAIDDLLYELDETVVVWISNAENAAPIGDQEFMITITDDDPAPQVTLTVDRAKIAEAGEIATVTATLSSVSGLPATIDLGFSGNATLTDDYIHSGVQIVIAAGTTSGTVTITAEEDLLDENDESVIVTVVGVTDGVESGEQQVAITIIDNDGPAWQNSILHTDVNDDGVVAPIDVLQIINFLNDHGPQLLRNPPAVNPPPFLDVNGDGSVAPIDALIVINHLNRGAEGEAVRSALLTLGTGQPTDVADFPPSVRYGQTTTSRSDESVPVLDATEIKTRFESQPIPYDQLQLLRSGDWEDLSESPPILTSDDYWLELLGRRAVNSSPQELSLGRVAKRHKAFGDGDR